MLACEHCSVTKFFLNSQDLVILSQSVGTAWGAGLDLTSAKTANKVSDKVVLSFSRTMGDHDSPASSLRHVASLNGLSDGTNLVNLKEKGVAKLLVNASLHALRVGNKEIVSDDLDAITNLLGHLHV